jgi:hypothetical protein
LRDGKLYAINSDGTEKWSFQTGGPVESSPAIGSDATVYVGSGDGKLYAISPTGSQKWAFTTGGPVESSPAIGSDGTIYVGSNDYNLYAINPDGAGKWRFLTGGSVESSPAIGSDGTVYVGSYNGNFFAFRSSSRGLASSPWPMFHRNAKHTGRAPGAGRPCFIATAAYGSAFSSEVNALRQFRDKYLLTSGLGRAFISAYYALSPPLADCIAKRPIMGTIARIGLYPVLGLGKWLVGENGSR